MTPPPTIYLSNWSSRHPRPFTIMAHPRAWEHGHGRVVPLTPSGAALDLLRPALAERKAGTDSGAMERYRAAYEAQLAANARFLAPGTLSASLPSGEGHVLEDGDMLCCGCSAIAAWEGRCHRAWAAPHLIAAGWRVSMRWPEPASQENFTVQEEKT